MTLCLLQWALQHLIVAINLIARSLHDQRVSAFARLIFWKHLVSWSVRAIRWKDRRMPYELFLCDSDSVRFSALSAWLSHLHSLLRRAGCYDTISLTGLSKVGGTCLPLLVLGLQEEACAFLVAALRSLHAIATVSSLTWYSLYVGNRFGGLCPGVQLLVWFPVTCVVWSRFHLLLLL